MIEFITVIQARMSSSRLPGKVLMPLGGSTVLAQVTKRAATFSRQVIVCTSTDTSDDAIEHHCGQLGIVCVRGDLDDVFSRFQRTLRDPRVGKTTWFARVTADCPLVSSTLARLAANFATDDVDYLGFDSSVLPRGISLELVRSELLLALDAAQLDPPEREHVTLRFYEQAGRYRVRIVEPPLSLQAPNFRLTLDYPEDYDLLGQLFELDSELTGEAAISRLRADPALAALNSKCAQKLAR
jgi:spore coat polysaccharide biosynthesis protein SpsF